MTPWGSSPVELAIATNISLICIACQNTIHAAVNLAPVAIYSLAVRLIAELTHVGS